jgi:DNA-directed RNA polymerase subunit RPC12/RpoP
MKPNRKLYWKLADEELEDENYYEEEEEEDYFDDDSDIDDELDDDIDDNIKEDYDDSDTEEYENNSENSAYAFYVCDECNYRWEDIDIEKKGKYNGIERLTLDDMICPMCGSQSITKL